MRVILPSAYGFCSGVRSAVSKAMKASKEAEERALPCLLYGDLVHSRAVMDELCALGMVRIDEPSDSDPGILVIRAHGIPDAERRAFIDAGYAIVDATCPVVLHSQGLIRSSSHPVVIGHEGHSEVRTLLGSGEGAILVESGDDLGKLEMGIPYEAVVQTTFSRRTAEEIASKAEEIGLSIRFLNSICPASAERRHALEAILPDADAVVVCGDSASRNTMELLSLAERNGCPAFLVFSPDAIPEEVFSFGTIGLTAGASCPDTLIEEVRRRLSNG